MAEKKPEAWLRGPVEGVPGLLQPVAHALLQCREDVETHVASLSSGDLWTKPNGAASVGFHVRHAAGSLERLFTYARGEQLSAEQMTRLKVEGEPDNADGAASRLIAHFDAAIERALAQLRATDERTLTDAQAR